MFEATEGGRKSAISTSGAFTHRPSPQTEQPPSGTSGQGTAWRAGRKINKLTIIERTIMVDAFGSVFLWWWFPIFMCQKGDVIFEDPITKEDERLTKGLCEHDRRTIFSRACVRRIWHVSIRVQRRRCFARWNRFLPVTMKHRIATNSAFFGSQWGQFLSKKDGITLV